MTLTWTFYVHKYIFRELFCHTRQKNQLAQLTDGPFSREELCSGQVAGISHVQEERSEDKQGLITVVTLDSQCVHAKAFSHLMQFLYTGRQ